MNFPGNWTDNFISPDSALFTESVPVIRYEKLVLTKKLLRFIIPDFNLRMDRKVESVSWIQYPGPHLQRKTARQ